MYKCLPVLANGIMVHNLWQDGRHFKIAWSCKWSNSKSVLHIFYTQHSDGVTFPANLSWKHHISSLARIVSKLGVLRNNLTPDSRYLCTTGLFARVWSIALACGAIQARFPLPHHRQPRHRPCVTTVGCSGNRAPGCPVMQTVKR